MVADLERQFAGIKERLCDDEGRVRRFVNIYLNGDDIRFLSNLETAVKDGDELSDRPGDRRRLTRACAPRRAAAASRRARSRTASAPASILDLVGQHAAASTSRRCATARRRACAVYAKLEGFNPGGSVKDRPALWMVRDGLASGALRRRARRSSTRRPATPASRWR